MVRACQAGLQRAAQARRAPRERGDGGASPDLAYDVEEVVDVRLFMAWCHRPASRAQPLARACSGTGARRGGAPRIFAGSGRAGGWAPLPQRCRRAFSARPRERPHTLARENRARERESAAGGKNVDKE